jgi:hypothetical protein
MHDQIHVGTERRTHRRLLMLGFTTTLAVTAALLVPPAATAANPEVGVYTGTETVAGPGENDTDPVELGTRFTVSTAGSVTAIRFYKNSANTGTHTGALWSSSGARLASVTFTGESKTGWQTARLSTPVKIVTGQSYVASYHTDTGRYAAKVGAFLNGATIGNATIRAQAGVYRYGTRAYPSSTWQGAAYYVDALFTPQASTPTPSPTPSTTASASPQPSPSTSPSTSPSPSPSTTPSSCARDGSYVWSHLASCGWPAADNTGYAASSCPSGLVANAGAATRTIRITTANTAISCQNITGCLSIEAPNVSISNVKIACSSGKTGEAANGTGVIKIEDGASATIDHVEINAMSAVHACVWHQGTRMTANAVNCYGADDGIFSWADTPYSATTGDNFTITNSYFHDFTTKTANGHVDGYQTEGAGNGRIEHNTWLMTSDSGNEANSAIAVWNSYRSSHDIAVVHNLIAGGGFSVYAEDYNPSEASPGGGYSVTNVTFADNVFSTRLYGCVGGYGVWYTRGAPTDGWHRTGNTVLETGANIDSGNPSNQGRPCT